MSALGEQVLISRLTDFESLDTLCASNLPLEAIPTQDARDIVEWAKDYYFKSHRRRAPSRHALMTTWGERLGDLEISLLDVESCDTMDWAVDDLRGDFSRSAVQKFTREFATASVRDEDGDVHPLEVPEVIHKYAAKLTELSLSLSDNHVVVPVGAGIDERLAAYEERATSDRGSAYGLLTGWDAIDEHTGGIHPGEIGVIGAGAKVGKSYALADIAKNSWERFKETGEKCVIFTLENNKEMTLDRIACLGANVDGQRFERGTLTEQEVERIREFRKRMGDEVFVVEPGDDERTPQALYRQALLLGADSMVVDQLTWVEHPKPDTRRSRTLELRDILKMFKSSVTSGKGMPLLLAHQINRDGIFRAKKTGSLEMTDFADSSEVERIVHHAWGLYQSSQNAIVNRMLFQTLADRRVPIKHWMMSWRIGQGLIEVLGETELPRIAVPSNSGDN